jgi:polyphosphate kinase
MSSGNYNEDTARIYTDVAVLSAREEYANDVAELFNFITGHSKPTGYRYLLTSPYGMRNSLINLIKSEAENAQKGLPSGIVIKVNSLEDKAIIDAFYEASQSGVKIELIVRGICCLRPQRKDLSENITVRSLVGEFLEHARLYYFHQAGEPKIYGGSADMMNRSFDRRIEALFLIVDEKLKQEAINILAYNLKGNANAYLMDENGEYKKRSPEANEKPFNVHKEFFKVTEKDTLKAKLFEAKSSSPIKITKTKENEIITNKK